MNRATQNASTISLENRTLPGQNSIVCPKHSLPIRGVCLNSSSSTKLVCGKCFKEFPEEMLKSYEDIHDFLSQRKQSEFSEYMTEFEKDTQKNQNLLKSLNNSIDVVFQKFFDQTLSLKDRFKELLKKQHDFENQSILKLLNQNVRLKTTQLQLNTHATHDALLQYVNDYIEVSKLVVTQSKIDRNRFLHFGSEKFKQCSLQLELSKNLLEKVILNDDLPLLAKHGESNLRHQSVSPERRTQSKMTRKFSSHDLPKLQPATFQSMPLTHRPKGSEKAKSSNIVESMDKGNTDLRKSGVFSFETIDTKLKTIESFAHIPQHDMIVFGGTVRGDQYHKLLFLKLSPEPNAVRIITAHAGIISQIAVGKTYVVSCSRDKMLKVWDLMSFEIVTVLRHENPIHGIIYDDQFGRVYSYGYFTDIRVWDIEGQKELSSLKVPTENISQMTLVSFTRDSEKKFIAAGCEKTGRVFLLDVKINNVVLVLNEQIHVGYAEIKFVPEENMLIACSLVGSVIIWDLNKPEPPLLSKMTSFNLENSPFHVSSMAVGEPDGLIFVVNTTKEIMVTSWKDVNLKGTIKFVDEEMVQHSKLLYLPERKVLYSINKFSGRINLINVSSLLKGKEKTGNGANTSIDMNASGVNLQPQIGTNLGHSMSGGFHLQQQQQSPPEQPIDKKKAAKEKKEREKQEKLERLEREKQEKLEKKNKK